MCINNTNYNCGCSECNQAYDSCADQDYTDDGCLNPSLPLGCSNYSGDDIICNDLSITLADTGNEVIQKLAEQICNLTNEALQDKFVKIDANDSTSSYLTDKLEGSTYIDLTVLNPNLNEVLRVDLKTEELLNYILSKVPEDSYTKISSTDTTSGYLVDKIVAGQGISITKGNSSGNENLSVGVKLSTTVGNRLSFDSDGGLLAPAIGDYFPILGIRTRDSINTRGWFQLLKDDTGNPFFGQDILGSGASGIASFEGVNNGWVLMGQDGINTITGQTFDLYGALRKPSGGFYPYVRMWHTGNIVEGDNVHFSTNSEGKIVISSENTDTGFSRFGFEGEDKIATNTREFDFNSNSFYLDNIGDLDFKTPIASPTAYNYSHFELTTIGGVINYYKRNGSINNFAQAGVLENPASGAYPAGATLVAGDYNAQISNTIHVSAERVIIGDRFLEMPATPTEVHIRRIANTVTDKILYYNNFNGNVTYGALPVAQDPLQTLTAAPTVVWDLNQGKEARITLNQNVTLSIINTTVVCYGVLTVVQDATGNRTITLPGGSKVGKNGGGVINLTSAPNSIDIIAFRYDGINFFWKKELNYT